MFKNNKKNSTQVLSEKAGKELIIAASNNNHEQVKIVLKKNPSLTYSYACNSLYTTYALNENITAIEYALENRNPNILNSIITYAMDNNLNTMIA